MIPAGEVSFHSNKESCGRQGLPARQLLEVTNRSIVANGCKQQLSSLSRSAAAVLLTAKTRCFHAEGFSLAVADGANAVAEMPSDTRNCFTALAGGGRRAKVDIPSNHARRSGLRGYLEPRILLQEIRGCREPRRGRRDEYQPCRSRNKASRILSRRVVVRGPAAEAVVAVAHSRRRLRAVAEAAGTGAVSCSRRSAGETFVEPWADDGSDFRRDEILFAVGGIPAQGRGFALVDGGRAGLQRHCGRAAAERGRVPWCLRDGLLAQPKVKSSGDKAPPISRCDDASVKPVSCRFLLSDSSRVRPPEPIPNTSGGSG